MGKPSHLQCGMSKVGRIPTLTLSGMIWNDIVNIGRIWYEMGIPYHTYIRLFIYMADRAELRPGGSVMWLERM